MTNTVNTAAASGCTILPDGSAFAVGSFPLPQDHWLYAPHEYEPGADEPKELLAPILTHAQRNEVVAAVRYAVRGATMCGKEPDFDPDALVQNAVYALCGSFGRTALAAPAQAAPAAVAGPSGYGPKVTVKRRCSDCKACNSESYAVQGDSGHYVYCEHPSLPERKYIGDTHWDTPDWCPAAAPTTQPAPQQDVLAAGGDSFLLLPTRPTPDAPANTAGLSWDAYSGAQMLAYGRSCSDAALVVAAPQQGPSQTAVQLAEMVLSDCGHSSNYAPLLNRVAVRIDAHVERCLESKKTPQQEAQEPVEIPAKCPYFGPSPHRDVWLEGWYAACATKPAPQPVEREPFAPTQS